ncbi:uncharacterized [Tachysurus ichikawai]
MADVSSVCSSCLGDKRKGCYFLIRQHPRLSVIYELQALSGTTVHKTCPSPSAPKPDHIASPSSSLPSPSAVAMATMHPQAGCGCEES